MFNKFKKYQWILWINKVNLINIGKYCWMTIERINLMYVLILVDISSNGGVIFVLCIWRTSLGCYDCVSGMTVVGIK